MPSVLGSNFVNASITNLERNVTLLTTGLVTLEDVFTLNILGENTHIATLNYSIPSAYVDHVQEVNFYTQFGDSVGIISSNNSRSYTVLYGEQVSTYQINITQNGEPANVSSGGVYFHSIVNALDVVTVTAHDVGQRGVADLPVVPMFQDLGYKDAMITVTTQGTQDLFVPAEITKLENRFGDLMPTFTNNKNALVYKNMTRNAFDYRYGLETNDLQTFTFDSTTPSNLDTTQSQVTSLVPTRISNAQRVVVFDPWGSVSVKETITVLNNGAKFNSSSSDFVNVEQISGFIFTFSSKSLLLGVNDQYGSLTHGTDKNKDGYPDTTTGDVASNKQSYLVKFRNPIYGGESYTFTANYRFNASEIIARDPNTKIYTMNTTLFSDFNVTVSNLNARFQFPVGTTLISQNYMAKSRFVTYSITSNIARSPLSAFNHFELVYQMTNATYVDNAGIQIMFTYNGVGHLQYAAMYFYITLAILGFAYVLSSIAYRPSKAIEIEKAQIPVNEMDNFFNYFSEKVGAEKRIVELRSRRQKGKLSKQDYDGQVKAIQKRIRDINPQLEEASKKLSSYGGRYENYVKRVMLSSQRQSDIRRNAREAKRSYEKGNIPKDIYQLRMKEYNDRLKKEETTINKTLTEMVEIIQKFNQ